MPRKIFSDTRPHDRWPPVTPTRTRTRWQDHPAVTGLFLFLALAAFFLLLGWGHHVDELAATEDTAYAEAVAQYQRGYAEGKAHALKTVAAAYAAGQADALESVQDTPQGVQLAQAGLAQGAVGAVQGVRK